MVSSEAKKEIARMFSEMQPEPPLAERRSNWEAEALLQALPPGARFTAVTAGGIASEWMDVPGATAGRVFLLLHGGGYNAGSPKTHRKMAANLGLATGMRVLVPDYRLAPEHPFPAAVDDALAAYEWLQRQGYAPRDIIVGGDSAGGGLTLSLLLTLKKLGKPMPRAAVLMAPWTDLTVSSPSYETLRALDPIIIRERLGAAGLEYAGAAGPRDPIASPLFADARGLPPLLIHAGGDEVMLDDSRLFAERAKAAGVETVFKIWPGLWHVFQSAAPEVPEAAEAMGEIGAFVRAQLSK